MKKGVETDKSLGEVRVKAVVFLRNCFIEYANFRL
ncbi:Hypothetical protein Cp267_0522 [Corynebacterium pseudotuberculosis 267]|nr:Hypothetical protein Cp267_0522 [Corynebacterium pseudotuberculosis 267]